MSTDPHRKDVICDHCHWPLAQHQPPGCPCMFCGQYGHGSLACTNVEAIDHVMTDAEYRAWREEVAKR